MSAGPNTSKSSPAWGLDEVARRIGGKVLHPPQQPIELLSLVSKGRHEQQDSLFVACRGRAADGHDYISQAFRHGSLAAVVMNEESLQGKPGVLVEDTHLALSRLAAAFAGDPSRDLATIGLTGTNGKTTVHWILYHALNRLERPAIRIGSLGIRAQGGRVDRSGRAETSDGGRILLTTPGPEEIHTALRQAVDAGIEYCVLETSSHALEQHRVADVDYNLGLFTNLTPDHLDYHPSLEDYFLAKVSLFEQMAAQRAAAGGPPRKAVINHDSPHGRRLIAIAENLGLQVFTFGSAPAVSGRIVAFEQSFAASRLRLEAQGQKFEISTSLIGDYNASNLAGAFVALIALGFDPHQAAEALGDVPQIPGRLESVGSEDIAVLVDYAHTGEGLRSLLSAVRGFVDNDLWVVFGCGGSKDPGKRVAMGAAASELADRIVLTSDNPRTEDPAAIVSDILESGCRPEFVELDRATAIRRALTGAAKGDVVVLAGKGHEDYQIIAGRTFHFSDREEAIALRDKGILER